MEPRFVAYQFVGWSDAIKIQSKNFNVLFVPQGWDHPLRLPNERKSNGEVWANGNAPHFLVVKTKSKSLRADRFDWVVRSNRGHYSVLTPEEFAKKYTRREIEQPN